MLLQLYKVMSIRVIMLASDRHMWDAKNKDELKMQSSELRVLRRTMGRTLLNRIKNGGTVESLHDCLEENKRN